MPRHRLFFAIALCSWVACAKGAPADRAELQDPFYVSPACEPQQQAARQLLDDAQQCSSDEDCVSQLVTAPCLLAFLCPPFIGRTADLARVQAEAARLSAAFRACTDSCSIASCSNGEGTRGVCNTATWRCGGPKPAASPNDDGGAIDQP
jgi:hypothetical protein